MAGEAQPASGTVTRAGHLGYLPQDPRDGDLDVLAHNRILSARGLDDVLVRLRRYELQMAETDGERREQAMKSYERAEAEHVAAGGYAAEAEAARIGRQPRSARPGAPRAAAAPVRWTAPTGRTGAHPLLRRRHPVVGRADQPPRCRLDHLAAHLAAGLFGWPDHDQPRHRLLDATINKVFHLDANRSTIDLYSLNWKLYLQQRESDEKRRKRELANAQKKADALNAQAEKMRAKATKATAAQNMLKRAERLMAGVEGEREADRVAKIAFPTPAPCGKTPLMAEDLSKSYGSLEVFTSVDLAIDRGSKVVILGLNGAGKTTLMRILAGVEQSDTGNILPGHGLKIGYFAQEHDLLDLKATVLQNMQASAADMNATDCRKVLGSFLFTGDDVDKPAGVLSGGEKTRLALAMLVVSAANLLLLDEPTNNLDPASRREVLEAIRTYKGAMVLVTHDEGAVEALEPDRVLLLPDGVEDLWNADYAELVSLA